MSSEIFGGRKSKKFEVKSEISKIFRRFGIFLGNRGKSETEGKCIIASEGMDPLKRGDLGQEITFIDKIRKRRVTWSGHVTRMENSRPRLPAVALFGQLEGTRSRGRQP